MLQGRDHASQNLDPSQSILEYSSSQIILICNCYRDIYEAPATEGDLDAPLSIFASRAAVGSLYQNRDHRKRLRFYPLGLHPAVGNLQSPVPLDYSMGGHLTRPIIHLRERTMAVKYCRMVPFMDTIRFGKRYNQCLEISR